MSESDSSAGPETPDEAAPGVERASFPWPPAVSESPIVGLARTWRQSVFEPGPFFGAMPTPGPAGPAVLYYLIVGIAGAAIHLFWQTLFRLMGFGAGRWTPVARMLGQDPNAGSPVVGFLLSPLLLLVQLILWTGVVHAFLWVFGGARCGFRTTLCVLSFAYGPILFLLFPLLGGWVALVWIFVLQIIGLAAAHRTDGWRAALAVLTPAVVVFILGILVAVLVVIGRLGIGLA